MTFTYEFDLYWAQMNHHAENLGQRSYRSKVIERTHTDTHRVDRSYYGSTKVVCNHFFQNHYLKCQEQYSLNTIDGENTLDNVFKILFKILPLKCI